MEEEIFDHLVRSALVVLTIAFLGLALILIAWICSLVDSGLGTGLVIADLLACCIYFLLLMVRPVEREEPPPPLPVPFLLEENSIHSRSRVSLTPRITLHESQSHEDLD